MNWFSIHTIIKLISSNEIVDYKGFTNFNRKQITVDKNEVIDNIGFISPESYPGMTLVWRDEFNGTELDPKFWNFEEGKGNLWVARNTPHPG